MISGDEDILLADYGTSNSGRLKTLYRHGSGHPLWSPLCRPLLDCYYNLSFGDNLFTAWQQQLGDTQSLTEFKMKNI